MVGEKYILICSIDIFRKRRSSSIRAESDEETPLRLHKRDEGPVRPFRRVHLDGVHRQLKFSRMQRARPPREDVAPDREVGNEGSLARGASLFRNGAIHESLFLRFLSEQTRRSSTTFKKIFGRSFTTEATGSLSRKRVSIRGSLNRSRSLIVSDSSEPLFQVFVLAITLIHMIQKPLGGPSPTYSKQSSIDDEEGSQHTTPSGYATCNI